MSAPRRPVGTALVLVAIGVVLLLDRAGTLDAGPTLVRWWPVSLVLVGAARAVVSPRDPRGGAVLAGIGALVLLRTTGVVTNYRFVWPLLLIAAGAWLVLDARRRATRTPSSGTDAPGGGAPGGGDAVS